MLSNNLIEESRRLRKNLYSQGATRHLSDKDFQNYKSASINNCIRSEEDLISPIPNEIDGIVDLDILKNLKIFSSTIKDLEEKIEAATSKPPPSLPSSAVVESLEELTKKIAEYIDEIMPPQFIQSMLILPKDQLHKYKLHKIVLREYNEYIQETCQVVDDISNRLSMHVQSYSYIKNIKRKSRNSFPSFKNKLNEILLKHSNEFGFEEKEPSQHQHHHQKQQHQQQYHHHQQQQIQPNHLVNILGFFVTTIKLYINLKILFAVIKKENLKKII